MSRRVFWNKILARRILITGFNINNPYMYKFSCLVLVNIKISCILSFWEWGERDFTVCTLHNDNNNSLPTIYKTLYYTRYRVHWFSTYYKLYEKQLWLQLMFIEHLQKPDFALRIILVNLHINQKKKKKYHFIPFVKKK